MKHDEKEPDCFLITGARQLLHRFWTLPLIACLLLPVGCSTIQMLKLPRLPQRAFARSVDQAPFRDFQGVIHVHSKYSHDSKGKISEIVRAGKKAGLDFVILTEHNNLRPLVERKEGFYDGVLLLAGEEVSTRAGHLLALNIRNEISPALELPRVLKSIESDQGLAFIAHPTSPRRPWTDWETSGLAGLEVYNLSADVYQENRLMLAFRFLFYWPDLFFKAVVNRPDRALEIWDRELGKRRMVALGAVDAHQKVRFLGFTLDEYDSTFRAVQTHVFAKRLSKRLVYEALREGHGYVAFNLRGLMKNFYFTAHSEDKAERMGGEIDDSENLVFHIFLPRRGTVELLKDGVRVARVKVREKNGALRKIPASGKGVYRVEVYKRKKLWVISNPIYVR